MHQLLAVLPGLKSQAEKISAETSKTFTTKEHLFAGMVKSFKAKDEANRPMEQELSESKPLSETIKGKLGHLAEHLAPYLDAEFQRDLSNMASAANLKFGDLVAKDVPATFLLQLRKELTALRGIYDAIPTLDPKREWKRAPDQGEGVWIAPPEYTSKTKKENCNKVVVPATDHHPAQVQAWVEDVPIGMFETKHRSGLITPEQKYKLLKRLDEVISEVVRALAEANQVEHKTEKLAEKILGYINGVL